MARPTSLSSIVRTESSLDDAESAIVRSRARVSHFDLVFDPAGVTWEVLDKEYSGKGTERSPHIVTFLADDPHNPYLFPKWKKWMITVLQTLASIAVAFTSSTFSGGIASVVVDLETSTEVAILGVSLFVLGFAVGPLLWAPCSGESATDPPGFHLKLQGQHQSLIRTLHHQNSTVGEAPF
jgi:hypothetical protein